MFVNPVLGFDLNLYFFVQFPSLKSSKIFTVDKNLLEKSFQ